MEWKVSIDIPIKLIQEAIDAGVIQTYWNVKSSDLRWNEVQRREYHFSQLVISIIIRELEKQRRLPYNPSHHGNKTDIQ